MTCHDDQRALAVLTSVDLTPQQLRALATSSPTDMVNRLGLDLAKGQALLDRAAAMNMALYPTSNPQRSNTAATWVVGRVVNRPRMSIIGSRSPSPLDLMRTRECATMATRHSIGVVSDLAYGVDIEAHRATLDAGGYTVAVLAGGLDVITPTDHRDEARKIVAHSGALMSGFAPGIQANRNRSLSRSQTMASISRLMLVVCAEEAQCAATAAARRAHKIGIRVLTFAGSPGSDVLIEQGIATEITRASNLVGEFKLIAKPIRSTYGKNRRKARRTDQA